MFAYMCLYLSLFSQLVKNGMVLTMMNSDFSQKSFVMMCEECLHISIYIKIYFLNLCKNDMLLSMINSDFCQKSFVMLCEECLQISIYFYPLFFQMVSHDMFVEYDKFRFQPVIICNAVCEELFAIYVFIFILIFSIGEKTAWC